MSVCLLSLAARKKNQQLTALLASIDEIRQGARSKSIACYRHRSLSNVVRFGSGHRSIHIRLGVCNGPGGHGLCLYGSSVILVSYYSSSPALPRERPGYSRTRRPRNRLRPPVRWKTCKRLGGRCASTAIQKTPGEPNISRAKANVFPRSVA